ncbi:MAG: ABC transporter permease [Kofleriaceae bacterium]
MSQPATPPARGAPPKDAAARAGQAAAPATPVPQPPPWYATLRVDPPAWIGKLLGLACVALVLAVWWFVTRGATAADRIISPSKLPSPGEVWDALAVPPDGAIVDGIIASLWRVFKGFLWATLIGVGLGIIAGSFRAIAAFFQPLIIFGRSVPISALIPVTLLFFGIGEKQKAMFIFFATVPFVFSDTVKALALVPERYVETAQTLGASRFQIITKVLVPLALPEIVTSLRFLFGLAFGYIALTETINTTEGLGFLINIAERTGKQSVAYLMLFIIAILAFSFDWVLRLVQRNVFHYRKDL